MKWMRRSRSFDTAPLPYEKKWAIEIGCKLTPIMFAQTVSNRAHVFTHISRGALLRAWRDDWRDTLSRSSYTRCVRAMHRFRAPSVAFRRALSDAVHTPVRAGNAPIKFDAVKDKPYSWCTCGLSKKQPLCDGSHKGTGLKSLKVVPTESKPIMLCTCKLTKNTDGGCDGSHKIPVT
jgi:CDGSH-type Zn-finger protein